MRIGYACNLFSKPNLKYKTCRLKNATDERLDAIIVHNLKVLDEMIDFNIDNDIRLFRISSDIIPFATHPINRIDWKSKYSKELKKIGAKTKSAGIRVSMHPGQYTVLNSPDGDIVRRAVSDIHYHAVFLDSLEQDDSSKIVLHIGGTYDDKEAALKRFVRNFTFLDSRAAKRLVIENDEKSFNVQDVLSVAAQLDIPCVFDTLHHEINPGKDGKSIAGWIDYCNQSWGRLDGNQKIHYSQQGKGKRVGAHSLSISHRVFIELYESLQNQNIDIMLEVKDKEVSAIKCNNLIRYGDTQRYMKQEWDRYRLLVMSRSQSIHDEIVQSLRNGNDLDFIDFYDLISQAVLMPVNLKQARKAMLIIWESIADVVSQAEKNKFLALVRQTTISPELEIRMRAWLYKKMMKYEISDFNKEYYLTTHF